MKARKAVVSAINSIKNRTGKLSESIHAVGVDCLEHAAESGDLTLLSKLHDAVGPTYKKRLRAWAAAYAPVVFHDGQFKKLKNSDTDFLLADAAAVSPDQLAELNGTKVPTEAKAFSATKEIENLKKYLLKVQKNLTSNEVGGYDDALAKIAEVIDHMEAA